MKLLINSFGFDMSYIPIMETSELTDAVSVSSKFETNDIDGLLSLIFILKTYKFNEKQYLIPVRSTDEERKHEMKVVNELSNDYRENILMNDNVIGFYMIDPNARYHPNGQKYYSVCVNIQAIIGDHKNSSFAIWNELLNQLFQKAEKDIGDCILIHRKDVTKIDHITKEICWRYPINIGFITPKEIQFDVCLLANLLQKHKDIVESCIVFDST